VKQKPCDDAAGPEAEGRRVAGEKRRSAPHPRTSAHPQLGGANLARRRVVLSLFELFANKNHGSRKISSHRGKKRRRGLTGGESQSNDTMFDTKNPLVATSIQRGGLKERRGVVTGSIVARGKVRLKTEDCSPRRKWKTAKLHLLRLPLDGVLTEKNLGP